MRRRWDADPRYDAQYDASYDPRGGYGPRRRRGGGWTVIGTPFGILGGGRRGFGPGYGGRRRGYGGGGGCARDACLLESGCCLAESLDGSCLLLTLLALPQLVLALVRPGSPPPRGSQLGGAGRASRVLLALLAVYQRSISGRRTHPVCRYTPSCSAYAAEAVSRYGALRGVRLAVGRLLRCRPGAAGGPDPVR